MAERNLHHLTGHNPEQPSSTRVLVRLADDRVRAVESRR